MSFPIHISPWAVLVSGFGSLAIGFFWLSSPRGLFGTIYSQAMYGRSPEQAELSRERELNTRAMKRSFPIYILFSIVTGFCFALLLETWRAAAPFLTGHEATLAQGAMVTALLWVGFTFPHALAKVVWQFKSWKVVAIDSGNELLRACFMLLLFWFWRG